MTRLTDSNVKVIIFGQHYMNTLGQVRSFGEVGCRPDVIWQSYVSEYVTSILSKSKYINQLITVDSFEEGLDFIINKYNDSDTKYIISTDSDLVVSLLDSRYDELKNRYIFYNAANKGRLNQFMTKDAQCRLAEECGLRVPRSEVVHKGDLPQEVTYPLLTKTVDCFTDNWKKNYIVCKTEQELLEAYKALPLNDVLLQEYVERENEVALEGISFNQGEMLYMPIQGEYLRIGEFGYGTWKRNEAYHLGDELRDKIQLILRNIKYSGVFEVEFLKTVDGKLFFLEFNFRHTQYNHTLTDMGVNLCKIHAESELNGRLCIDDVNADIEPRVVMNERTEFFRYVETKKISLKSWISDIRKTDSFYIYDKNDIKPIAFVITKYLKGFICNLLTGFGCRLKNLLK